jgi:hypothetical protein
VHVVENKDKLFYCISNVGNSVFLRVYLFNDDKLQYEWQKLQSTFVFNVKTNTGKLNSPYLQTSINALLNSECFIILYIALVWNTAIFIGCVTFYSSFFFPSSVWVSSVPFSWALSLWLIFIHFIILGEGLPLLTVRWIRSLKSGSQLQIWWNFQDGLQIVSD